jgi:hypothetical protein
MRTISLWLVLGLLTAAFPVFADEPAGNEGKSCREYGRHWAFAPIFRYYGLNGLGGVERAFVTNGFSEFDRQTPGFGLLVNHHTDAGWQLGLGIDGVSQSDENGGSVAEYSSGRLGIWIGRDLLPGSPFDLTVGTQVGFGAAELLIVSAVQDGRVQESFAFLEPTLLVGYAVSQHVKLALGGSYLASASVSDKKQGDNLGVERVSPKAWSLQFQLLFGTF